MANGPVWGLRSLGLMENQPEFDIDIDIDNAIPDMLLLIQQKLRIVQYRYGSLSSWCMILDVCYK